MVWSGRLVSPTADQYLKMWLSEQIPLDEWIKLLDKYPLIEKAYKDHMNNKKEK